MSGLTRLRSPVGRAVGLAVGLAAGCSHPAQRAPVRGVLYACEQGRRIEVAYPDPTTARVSADGKTAILKVVISGSGARYIGDGLQWWSKGDEGRLSRLAPGEDYATDAGVICVPPARAPGSAQGAVAVVKDYYALVEAGKLTAAAKLRTDGVVEDVKPFATLAVEVGRPGAVEGAAGSLYVEIPTVLYGRYVTGGAYRRVGKVTLRRVNDVPGATAEQLRWRIAWIALSP